MNESYEEVVVKRKETAGTIAIRVGLMIAAGIAVLLALVSANTVVFVIAAILIFGIVYIFPRLSVEYEYVYCDGQIDFDKIMGRSSRKTALKIQFDQVEMMAPLGSHALDGYTHVQAKVKDFTSKNKGIKPYVIVSREGEQTTKILFEPNESMVQMIRHKYPRKVVQY